MAGHDGFSLIAAGPIRYWQADFFTPLGARGVFFQRLGGVSQGPFASLNLNYNTEDAQENIRANRTLAFQAAGLGPLLPVCGQQTHATRLRNVGCGDAGRGWADWQDGFPDTDGFTTSIPGLPLAVSVADCLPVLLADEQGKAVAAVHVGWRGVAGGILPGAVAAMRKEQGITPERLWAALGPAIGPGKFVVQADALTQLQNVFPEAVVPLEGGKTGYNLWAGACHQLVGAGLKPGNIKVLNECTSSHPRAYFSHRRDRQTGRMLAVVQLLPHT